MTTIKVQLEDGLDQDAFPVDRYKPMKELGRADCGITYLCTDLLLDQTVVVKTLKPVEMETIVEFQKEAKILCRIDHKHIAQLIDFGATSNGAPYIVVEHHAGITLADHLANKGRLSPEEAVKTFLAIAEALAQLHKIDLLYRDIRASNILVKNIGAPDQNVMLLELGAGKVKRKTALPFVHEGKKIVGEPGFIAPEEIINSQYDVRSELYVLGCTMFESLTGRAPFVGQSHDQTIHLSIRRSPPTLTQVSPGLSFPHRLEALVAKCLAKSPDTRYQTMDELIQVLKDLSKVQLLVEQVERAPEAKNQESSNAPTNDQAETSDPMSAGYEPIPSNGQQPAADRRVDLMLEDGSKFTLKCDEAEEKVKLVNADPAPKPGSEKVYTVDSPLFESTQSVKAAQANMRQVLPEETKTKPKKAKQEKGKSEKEKPPEEKPPEPQPADPAVQAAPKGPNWHSIFSLSGHDVPGQAEPTTKKKLLELLKTLPKRTAQALIDMTTYQKLILGTIVLVCLPLMTFLIHREMTYVALPPMVGKGVIMYYSPWTEKGNGRVDFLIVRMNLGGAVNIPIVIDSEEKNLPEQEVVLGASNTHLGELWQLEFKERGDSAYLEDSKFLLPQYSGSIQDAIYTVSTKFDDLVKAGGNNKQAAFDAWSKTDVSETGLRQLESSLSNVKFKESQATKLENFHLFDTSDIKVEYMLMRQLSLMIRTSKFMLTGPTYMRLLLTRDKGKWQIQSAETISEDDWNRKSHSTNWETEE